MNNYNGKVVIGTQIDTKQFDKDYDEISKKIDELDKKANKIATMDNPAETDLETYNKTVEKIKELREEQENINRQKQEAIKQQQQVVEKQQETNTEISKEEEQIKKLSNELYKTFSEYEEMQKTISEAKIFDEKDVEYSEKLKNKIKDIAKEYEKITGSKLYVKGITDIEPQVEKTNKSFDKLINKIKKVGLSLFGIQTVYALVSKASSAYLSQDTELAQKLQSVWVGLGTFLAPALEGISNALLKALGYLNVFIKALTGVDYIAKANAKSLKKQADAQKQLATGIDEVTNLQESTGGDKTSGLIEIPELDDRIVKKLQNLALAIKENWTWLKALGIMFGTVFGISKISGILSNIGLLTGAKGLGGIPRAITIGLTLAGVTTIITTIGKIKSELNELNAQQDGLIKNSDEIYNKIYSGEKSIDDLLKDQAGRRKTINETYEKSQKWINKRTGLSKRYLKDIQLNLLSQDKILEKIKEQYETEKLSKEQKQKVLQGLVDQYNTARKMIPILEEQGINTDKIESSTKNYAEQIKKVSKELGINEEQLYNIIQLRDTEKGKTEEISETIKKINDTKLEDKTATYKVKAEADTSKMEKDYNNAFTRIGESIGNIFTLGYWKKIWKFAPKVFGNFLSGGGKGGGKGGGRGFADGGIIPTVPLQGVVYNPGPGVNIGGGNFAGEKGAEVIFPLQNSRFIDDFANQLAGKLGDGTNTQLLLELNRNIAELADRPIILNVNGKSFAQATYQDYRNEQKRQNDNTQIVRS